MEYKFRSKYVKKFHFLKNWCQTLKQFCLTNEYNYENMSCSIEYNNTSRLYFSVNKPPTNSDEEITQSCDVDQTFKANLPRI